MEVLNLAKWCLGLEFEDIRLYSIISASSLSIGQYGIF
jgi:hypothetical protein